MGIVKETDCYKCYVADVVEEKTDLEEYSVRLKNVLKIETSQTILDTDDVIAA